VRSPRRNAGAVLQAARPTRTGTRRRELPDLRRPARGLASRRRPVPRPVAHRVRPSLLYTGQGLRGQGVKLAIVGRGAHANSPDVALFPRLLRVFAGTPFAHPRRRQAVQPILESSLDAIGGLCGRGRKLACVRPLGEATRPRTADDGDVVRFLQLLGPRAGGHSRSAKRGRAAARRRLRLVRDVARPQVAPFHRRPAQRSSNGLLATYASPRHHCRLFAAGDSGSSKLRRAAFPANQLTAADQGAACLVARRAPPGCSSRSAGTNLTLQPPTTASPRQEYGTTRCSPLHTRLLLRVAGGQSVLASAPVVAAAGRRPARPGMPGWSRTVSALRRDAEGREYAIVCSPGRPGLWSGPFAAGTVDRLSVGGTSARKRRSFGRP